MPTLTDDEGTGDAGDDRHVLHRVFTERGLGEVDPWLVDRRPHRWTFSANLEPRRLTTRQLSFPCTHRAVLCYVRRMRTVAHE